MDEQAGADAYVRARAEWQKYITVLAPAMCFEMNEIDTAGSAIARALTR